MRQIEFRAKDENGVWVYGSLVVRSRAYGTKSSILEMTIDPTEPDKEHDVKYQTIGQFTGLLDKNSVKIWEGDIIEHGIVKAKSQVEFREGSFSLKYSTNACLRHYDLKECRVIGNIHDVTPQVSKEGGEP